jgi:hypothetical protein
MGLTVTPEEEEELIKKVAEEIHKREMDAIAIILLQTFKPLSFIGAEMTRLFTFPYLPALGEENALSAEKMLHVFEKHENVERVLKTLEELADEDNKKRKEEKESRKKLRAASNKKGLRRFIPF